VRGGETAPQRGKGYPQRLYRFETGQHEQDEKAEIHAADVPAVDGGHGKGQYRHHRERGQRAGERRLQAADTRLLHLELPCLALHLSETRRVIVRAPGDQQIGHALNSLDHPVVQNTARRQLLLS
jgi:hypothetical protein